MLVGGLFLKIVGGSGVRAGVRHRLRAGLQGGLRRALGRRFSFSMQVYCDFAGYSLAALGIAKMFGFHLPPNFEAPFASVGIAELWTRWHISLSNWLRDYVQPAGALPQGPAAWLSERDDHLHRLRLLARRGVALCGVGRDARRLSSASAC
jgi:hypothetical protein